MPEGGDVSICLNCAAWLVFNHDLTFRLMDADDILRLEPVQHKMLSRVGAAIRKIPRRQR